MNRSTVQLVIRIFNFPLVFLGIIFAFAVPAIICIAYWISWFFIRRYLRQALRCENCGALPRTKDEYCPNCGEMLY